MARYRMPGGHRRNCNQCDYYRYKEQTNMLHSYRAKKDYQVVDLALAELLQRMNKLEGYLSTGMVD